MSYYNHTEVVRGISENWDPCLGVVIQDPGDDASDDCVDGDSDDNSDGAAANAVHAQHHDLEDEDHV